MRRAARTDAAHAAIRKGLRKRGYWWCDLFRIGQGVPDALVAHPDWPDVNLLVEVKSLGGELTPDEQLFFNDWPGPKIIAFSVWDVIGWFEEHDDKYQVARR